MIYNKEVYTTKEVTKISGLKVARCNQYAARHGIKKYGRSYLWTQEQINDLIKRKREK